MIVKNTCTMPGQGAAINFGWLLILVTCTILVVCCCLALSFGIIEKFKFGLQEKKAIEPKDHLCSFHLGKTVILNMDIKAFYL